MDGAQVLAITLVHKAARQSRCIRRLLLTHLANDCSQVLKSKPEKENLFKKIIMLLVFVEHKCLMSLSNIELICSVSINNNETNRQDNCNSKSRNRCNEKSYDDEYHN